jgi:hypothetical protein
MAIRYRPQLVHFEEARDGSANIARKISEVSEDLGDLFVAAGSLCVDLL